MSCWFGWLKRSFVKDQNEEAKKWRWFSIGNRRRVKKIDEATEKQRKYAVKVAIATAAAAEAAVAAAYAAAEIVRLTAPPFHKYSDKYLAAIQIQSAFRRYLARKALVALKGVVKLQAVIRGEAVRRRIIKMKKLSIDPLKINSHIECTHFYPMDWADLQTKTKVESKSQTKWDYSMLCKEDIETLWSRKHRTNLKRDQMMKYSFSHRERRNSSLIMEESLPKRPEETARQRQSHWLQLQGMDYLKPTTTPPILTPDHLFGNSLQVRTNSTRKQDSIDGLYSPVSCPRRSFCRTPQTSIAEDNFVPNSPVFPTYMAATESAKAKARSISTPRQRIGTPDSSSEYKNRLSLCASYNGDMFSSYGMSDVSQFSPYSYKLKSPFLT